MKRMVIILADDNAERLRTALVTAAAHAALGGTASFFFQGAAVALLRMPFADPDSERQAAAGLPTLAQLLDEARGLGIGFAACQSSLALLRLSAANFDPAIEWTGMIGFLSRLDPNDQLMVI